MALPSSWLGGSSDIKCKDSGVHLCGPPNCSVSVHDGAGDGSGCFLTPGSYPLQGDPGPSTWIS